MTASNTLTSRTIDIMRFPLIIGVVIIHCFRATELKWSWLLEYVLSQDITRVCVPLYFAVSGYLFFYNVTAFEKSIYIKKVSSRVRTVLLPYIIWNAFCLIRFTVKPLMRGDMDFVGFLHTAFDCFVGRNLPVSEFTSVLTPSFLPADNPLWFLRDLFIYVLLSPVFFYILKSCGKYVLLLLSVCFLAGWWINGTVFSIPGILYFSVGAYFGIKKLNPSEILVAHRGRANILLAGWLCLIVADVATFGTSYHYYIHSSQIFIGVLAAYWCATVFAERCKSDSLMDKIPGGAVFCVFVMHAIILSDTSRLLLRMLGNSEVGFIFAYFANIVLSTVCPLIFYFVMNRFAPSILAFLLGGRSVPVAFKRR